jgi:hypothetical protein
MPNTTTAMKNLFSPPHRRDYSNGYEQGFDPSAFCSAHDCSEAFLSGFQSGRLDYERLNGRISDGIPMRIITHATLEEFYLAGMLGLEIGAEGFTPRQVDTVSEWYRRGLERYQPQHMEYLTEVLESSGIDLRPASELEE